MKEKPFCQKCKTYKGKLLKISKSPNKQSYYCRDCNTEKARKYRATQNGKLAIGKATMKSYYKHHDKSMARAKVSNAIASGKLKKPLLCQICSSKKVLQAHHSDYSKPLNVIWLCRFCHCEADKMMKLL